MSPSSPQAAPRKGVVIGAGYFSRFHYEAWTRIPEARIVAACDLNEERVIAAAREFNIPRHYTNWRQMLDEQKPDFVDIISPPATHEEICRELSARRIDIICQKPLAPTLLAAQRIVQMAQRAGIRFMVHENWRWQPWYREIKRIQQSGLLGDFTHIYFRSRMGDGWGENAYLDRQPFFREYPHLLIYETGVHFVDTFRYLMGEVSSVYANLRRLNPVIRGEDTGQIFLKFESGATAIWDANRYNESEATDARYTFGEMRIDAMKGHLTLDSEGTIRVKLLGQPAYDHEYDHPRINFAGDCVHTLQQYFFSPDFKSNAEDYIKTLRVVEDIYVSAAPKPRI